VIVNPWDETIDGIRLRPILHFDLAYLGIPQGLLRSCNIPDLRNHVRGLFEAFDDNGLKLLLPTTPAPCVVFHGPNADLYACRMLTAVHALHRVRQGVDPWMVPGPDLSVPLRPGFCRAVDAQAMRGTWISDGAFAGRVSEGDDPSGCNTPIGALAILSMPADDKARLFRAQDAMDCLRHRANAGLTTFVGIPGTVSTAGLSEFRSAPHIQLITS
jgi:hypothetical protein